MKELDGLKRNVLLGGAAREASRVLEAMQSAGLTRGQREEEVLVPPDVLQLGSWLGRGVRDRRLWSRWAAVAPPAPAPAPGW
jgi:hypothetical protein